MDSDFLDVDDSGEERRSAPQKRQLGDGKAPTRRNVEEDVIEDDSLEVFEEEDFSDARDEPSCRRATKDDATDDSDYVEGESSSNKKQKRGISPKTLGPRAPAASKRTKGAAAVAASLSEGDSLDNTGTASTSKGAAIKRPRLTAEEKQQAKIQKQLAKEADKRQKETDRAISKAARGGYAKEEIALSFEVGLANSGIGKQLAEGVAIEYAVIAPTEVPIPNAIFWRRRRIVGVKNAGAAAKRGAAAAAAASCAAGAFPPVNPSDAYIFEDDHGKLEPFVVVYWDGATFVDTLVSHGTDVIEEAVIAMRTALPPGTRVIFLIQGAAAHIHAQFERRKALERSASSGGGGGGASAGRVIPPVTTQHAYDSALMHLYVARDLEIKETLHTQESIDYLRGVTRAVAENPYRATPSALAVVTKVKVSKGAFAALSGGGAAGSSSSSSASASVGASMDTDAGGGGGYAGYGDDDDEYANYGDAPSANGSSSAPSASGSSKAGSSSSASASSKGIDVGETWFAMLQMIPGVSKDKALYIAREYPSFRALMDQYARHDLTTEQKRDLLTDIVIKYTGKGLRIRKVSEDCFDFFTSVDPDDVIGEATATSKAAAAKKATKAAAGAGVR